MSVRIALASPEPIPSEVIDLALGMLEAPDPEPATERTWGHGWSATGELAAELSDVHSARRALRPLIAHGVDATVVEGHLASKPPALLILDVDSTLTTSEAIDELAAEAGAGEQVAEITARAMRGELDFRESLTARVATLKGLDASVFERVRERTSFSPGAERLIHAVAASGARVALVSGGFAEIVVPLVAHLPVHEVSANTLEVIDGRLTGRVLGAVVDRAAKRTHLLRHAAELGIDADRAVAVGDGANDLDMIGAAGLGVAYCAKPLAADQADATISFPRLDAVTAYLRLG